MKELRMVAIDLGYYPHVAWGVSELQLIRMIDWTLRFRAAGEGDLCLVPYAKDEGDLTKAFAGLR